MRAFHFFFNENRTRYWDISYIITTSQKMSWLPLMHIFVTIKGMQDAQKHQSVVFFYRCVQFDTIHLFSQR